MGYRVFFVIVVVRTSSEWLGVGKLVWRSVRREKGRAKAASALNGEGRRKIVITTSALMHQRRGEQGGGVRVEGRKEMEEERESKKIGVMLLAKNRRTVLLASSTKQDQGKRKKKSLDYYLQSLWLDERRSLQAVVAAWGAIIRGSRNERGDMGRHDRRVPGTKKMNSEAS